MNSGQFVEANETFSKCDFSATTSVPKDFEQIMVFSWTDEAQKTMLAAKLNIFFAPVRTAELCDRFS